MSYLVEYRRCRGENLTRVLFHNRTEAYDEESAEENLRRHQHGRSIIGTKVDTKPRTRKKRFVEPYGVKWYWICGHLR